MEKAIIGKKLGMTQIFDSHGKAVPVTVIEAGPCVVVQKKTADKEGYSAVQLGFDEAKEKGLTKPEKGHFDKAGVSYKRILKEFKLSSADSMNVGDEIKVDVFSEGDIIDVTGISKGKGYAGAVKRWGSARGLMSHGGGPVHRSVGSTGANSSPSKVMKGKHMAGHMGNERVTVQNLMVAKVDTARNLLAVRGAVPGPRGGIVFVKNAVKNV